jgi:pantoate kinase
MNALAFAPGHITGFFEPVYHPADLSRCGSRGAGVNILFGAYSQVTVNNSTNKSIEIFINGCKSPAPVTALALNFLIGDNPLNITVKTRLDLPMGQGFGMSAAGALSTCLATAKICGLPNSEALRASHFAEVNLGTGLGDVISSFFGGFEIRKSPGLPPWGLIEHIPGNYDIVLCIIGKKINTKKILVDKNLGPKISEYGKLCTKKILENPSVENLFSLSKFFTNKTGLGSKAVIDAINDANNYGMSSMCMLGNSVFAIGKTEDLTKVLSKYGRVYVTGVDGIGSRILK